MPTEQKPRFKRKQYFILPKFQLRYIRVILLITFGVGALCAYTVYYQSMLLLGGKLANVYPQGRLVALVKSVNLQILISLLLITPLLVLIGMFLSHRIAGPIYRLEMALANISKGDMTAHITLRPKDELKPLAAGINAAIDALRSRIASERGVVDNLHKIINELDRLAHAKPFELGPLTNEISRLKGKISDLDKSLAEYKI